jgi:hypothetical protein
MDAMTLSGLLLERRMQVISVIIIAPDAHVGDKYRLDTTAL